MEFMEHLWYCGDVDDCLRCSSCPYENIGKSGVGGYTICDMIVEEFCEKYPFMNKENYAHKFWLTAESFFSYMEGEN